MYCGWGGLGGLGAQGGRNWLITSGRRQPPAFCPNILAFLFCFFGQSSLFVGLPHYLLTPKKSNCLKTFFPIFSFVGSKVVKMPFLVLSVVCDSNRHILQTYSIFFHFTILHFYDCRCHCPILSNIVFSLFVPDGATSSSPSRVWFPFLSTASYRPFSDHYSPLWLSPILHATRTTTTKLGTKKTRVRTKATYATPTTAKQPQQRQRQQRPPLVSDFPFSVSLPLWSLCPPNPPLIQSPTRVIPHFHLMIISSPQCIQSLFYTLFSFAHWSPNSFTTISISCRFQSKVYPLSSGI